MLNKFSVGYNLEKNKKKKEESISKMVSNREKRNVLNQEVAEYMLSIGFNIDQIYKAFNIYKFTTVEEAVNIMMRDPEINKFLHRFVQGEKRECQLCGFNNEDHLEYTDLHFRPIDEEACLRIPDPANESIINDPSKMHNGRTLLSVNNIKIDIPKHILDDFEDPYICRICFNNKLNVDPKVSFSCNHEFCKMCVTNYLNTNIVNGNVLQVKCLYGGCPRKFTNEEIKENVDEEHWDKYKKFYYQKVKLNDPEAAVMNCPYPDCEELVEYDQTEVRIFVQCEKAHQFCSKCKEQGWHQEGRCEKYDNSLLKQIQKGKGSENYKQCPRCRVIIEKNEGCNQMKCISCDLDFCWICMKQYTLDHYAIYNFTGCPGMRFSAGPQEKSCLDNKCVKCLWLLLSCLIGFLAVILILAFFFFFGCPYELIKCYIEKKFQDEDENSYVDEDIEAAQPKQNEEEVEQCTGTKITICILFGLLGLALQPFYLLFYVLYGMMECYRRFGCWVFYASY